MRSLLLGLTLLAAVQPASAMEFELQGNQILASGEIFEGDTQKFAKVVAAAPKDENLGVPLATVSFESPGGNLFEGMRLGAAIRAEGMPTLVQRGHTCASACAIAYLGGKYSGASSDAVGRELEVGARLGYHGFALAGEEVQLVNETLDSARLVNALLLEYAAKMGSVNLAALARLLNTPPSVIEQIDTPREIDALGITLVGAPPKPPKGWSVQACRVAVAERLSSLDYMGLEGRVHDGPEPLSDLGTFRTRLLDDMYPESDKNRQLRSAIMQLPASDGIDLLAGQALYSEGEKIGVWRVILDRGAGFYFNACYAVTDFHSIRTIMIDSVSPMAVTRTDSTLIGFPADESLW